MDNKKSEWFSTWFDSPLYHVLYQNHDDEEAHNFLDLLIARLGMEDGARVLDLGCGRGRYARYLGDKNFDVLGVDLSQNSIAYAANFEHDNLHFRVHDMRHPVTGEKFNYILNLFTSFGYFSTDDEDRAVLNAVRKSITDNGTLIIDFINGENARKNLIKENSVQIDGMDFNITRWIEDDRIYKKIEVNDMQFREEVKLLSLEKFKEYADKTGFEISEVFGNYQLQAYDSVESDRLIMVFNAI